MRALDVAGHTAEVDADVTLDVGGRSGRRQLRICDRSRSRRSHAAGRPRGRCGRICRDLGRSPGDTGSTRYLVGFSSRPVPPDELTTYTTPGRHTEPVAPGDTRYAVVRYMDEHGNTRTVEAGPFFVD
ncbi:MAG: hypothetical protein R3A10_16460 [Caldilineaceae bacterium]